MSEPRREDPPSCFGKLWDPKVTECVGGIDPAFTAEDGSHRRGRCMFFDACGAKLQASKMESARNLLDPKNLVKHQPVQTQPQVIHHQQQQQGPMAAFVEKFAHSLANQPYVPKSPPVPVMRPVQVHQPPPPPPVQAPVHYAHQQAYVMPQHYPQYQQMIPVNYQMPGYLSVPEVRNPEEGLVGLFARTVFRSMGKSLGHSIAHLFDVVQLGHPNPPYGNSGSGDR